MNTVKTTSRNLLNVSDKHTETHCEHGLIISDDTSEPDLSKNVINQAQQATETASSSQTKQTQLQKLDIQSKKNITEEENNDNDQDNNNEIKKNKPPTEEQIVTVEEILKQKSKDCSDILELKKKESGCQNQAEFKAYVLKAFIKQSALIHSEHNKHEHAEKAHCCKQLFSLLKHIKLIWLCLQV